MPEVFVCDECKKIIDPAIENYIDASKATNVSTGQWRYLHAPCYEELQNPRPPLQEFHTDTPSD